jgi:putative pyruvate formate lyase activating enzyme
MVEGVECRTRFSLCGFSARRTTNPAFCGRMVSGMTQRFIDQLAHCECCPRRCGVDRRAGQTGYCRIGGMAPIAHAGLHFGEEPPISGTRGSGTIFFAGCNLRCVFCQNHQISQEFQPGPSSRWVSEDADVRVAASPQRCCASGHEALGMADDAATSSSGSPTRTLTTEELAGEMLRLAEAGAHNINLVSPTHVVLQAADAIVMARNKGLTLPIVYNSNGYDSVDVLRQVAGLIDIYLPDIKYLSNDLARRYSAAGDYADVVPGVLREMLRQVGHLQFDDDGIARRGLLVRHLVLPEAVDNSRQCLAFLAELAPATHVSVMSQYSPRHRAADYPAISRPLTAREYDEVTEFALELGLENAFIQELDSRERYLPDFNLDRPFE